MKKRILFVCVGNSGRSQMAEAFFKQHASSEWLAMSAGIKPDKKIHPYTVELMKEVGIETARNKPKKVNQKMLKQAYMVIVMDSHVLKEIPSQYLAKTENWRIKSLLGAERATGMHVRDEIEEKVQLLIEKLGDFSQNQS